jgi:hypothetical protein
LPLAVPNFQNHEAMNGGFSATEHNIEGNMHIPEGQVMQKR